MEHVYKNINVGNTLKTQKKCLFLPTLIQNGIWFTAKIFNIHEKIHWTGRNLLSYFQADVFGKRRPSEIFGKVVAHCEKQSLSSSHCPFATWQAVNSVSASLPSFKPPSQTPVVGFCVVARVPRPLKKKKKRELQQWVAVWRCPVHVSGYTPSSMPMKSEPFCIVMEAPAALSTNMEVYCPACGEENTGVMPNDFTHAGTSGLCVCARLTCSSSRPCTLTVNILLLLSNPTIISSELQRKTQKYKGVNLLYKMCKITG